MNIVAVILILISSLVILSSIVNILTKLEKYSKVRQVFKHSENVFGEVMCITEHNEKLGGVEWKTLRMSVKYVVDKKQYVIDNILIKKSDRVFKGQNVVVTYDVKNPANGLVKLDINKRAYFSKGNFISWQWVVKISIIFLIGMIGLLYAVSIL